MPTDDCFKVHVLPFVSITPLYVWFKFDFAYLVVKEDMKRRLKNTNMKPLSHSSYLRLQVLCQIFYDADEKLHVLDELSISDLKSFIPELCSQIHYTNVPIFVIGYYYQFVKLKFLTSSSSRVYFHEKSMRFRLLDLIFFHFDLYNGGLCHGNLLEDEAITLSNIFKSNFSFRDFGTNRESQNDFGLLGFWAFGLKYYVFGLKLNLLTLLGCNMLRSPLQYVPIERLCQFKCRCYNCKTANLDSNVDATIARLFEQEAGIESIRLKALIDLFDEIVEEPLFNQLRTKEQLGYVVECDPRHSSTKPVLSPVFGLDVGFQSEFRYFFTISKSSDQVYEF
ncbi:hypothetical protein DVH24_042356 [Malus domestica]|uniref:Coenzyme PQQ synthesis protein F-like C-terminal lobe domain-containing protein n=1 Tax=Malus domestica TaxID=3750 RepID=A0A498J0X3_MALDO|nr:hypothetical protein DVH24_042356 [Malus domestica]